MNLALRLSPILALALVATACGAPSSQEFDEQRLASVEADVRAFVSSIPIHLAERGPTAWLDHFDRGPDFFMASDGVEVFPDHATADELVRGFAPSIAAMEITWDSVRVHVLTPEWAVFSTAYRETLTDTSGVDIAFGGYVTATVVRRAVGWRIQNLHWSSPAPGGS